MWSNYHKKEIKTCKSNKDLPPVEQLHQALGTTCYYFEKNECFNEDFDANIVSTVVEKPRVYRVSKELCSECGYYNSRKYIETEYGS
jgi:hypothetical protein